MEAMTIEAIKTWAEFGLAVLLALASLPFGVWARRWLVRAAEAAGARVDESKLARLDWALMYAVAAAEEWARRRVTSGMTATGADKMDTAIDLVRSVAIDLVRDKSDTQLERLIEARLAQDRGTLAPATPTARALPTLKPL